MVKSSHHAVCYLPRTHLSYTWKCVHLTFSAVSPRLSLVLVLGCLSHFCDYPSHFLCSQWLPVVEVFPGLVSIPTVWRMLILMPAQILRGYKLPASSAPWCRLIGSLTFRQCLGKSGHQICTLGTMGERGLRAVFSLLPCAESEGIVSKSAYTTK